MIAGFTGHRPDKLGGYGTHEPLTPLATGWIDTVISGMARYGAAQTAGPVRA